MKNLKVFALLCCLAPVGVAVAETLVVDDQVQVRQSAVDRPVRGATMSAATPTHTPASDAQVMKDTKNLWVRART